MAFANPFRTLRKLLAAEVRARYIRNRSRHDPHQGWNEIQRRYTQIKRGIIATN